MVTKAVTQADLANLEKSIKLEISKEQTELRHEDSNKLQEYYYMVDDLKTDSALSKQSFLTMTKSIEKLEQAVIEWFKDIREEFKVMHNVFTTKVEHQANKVEIQEIKETHKKVITWLIWTVWTIFITFLGLIIKTLFIK